MAVRCERVLTGQVVLNLCFNAIDELTACDPDQREITITTRAEDGVGVLTAKEGGSGLGGSRFGFTLPLA